VDGLVQVEEGVDEVVVVPLDEAHGVVRERLELGLG